MTPHKTIAIILVLLAASVAFVGNVAATHPFEDAAVHFGVKLADNRPGVASDLRLSLRSGAPSTLPDPFGGIVYKTPGAWGIAGDDAVPDGDKVAQIDVVLDHPLLMDPAVCPAAPMPAVLLQVPLVDATSDSADPDYPPFLPPGDHKARWAGHVQYGETRIPVNVLVDARPDVLPGDRLQLFVGTGEGYAGLPPLDDVALHPCFNLGLSLNVFGQSSSGTPIAVNPAEPGTYTFIAEIRPKPASDPDGHVIVLKADVVIKGAPAGYRVFVRDHNPGVASALLMAINFRPKSPLPQPFGGVSHQAPSEWGIAPDEEVPDGDRVGGLHLRLNVPPTLSNICPHVLPGRPSLTLSVPLRDASSDSTANDYPRYLPGGEHKARWAGIIGKKHHGIPVNVLVDEKSSGGTTMRIFVGRGLLHLQPLASCLSLDVALHVAGHSSSGVPVAVNPAAEGTYTFEAHVVTLPKPSGEPNEFDLKAEVLIEAKPTPGPCADCPPGDEDGDAIIDELDACPEEPEDVDDHDASDGCPDSGDDDGDSLLNLVELILASDPTRQDSDSDGCADGAEVGGDELQGGRRDPLNAWDYFNPTQDGENRVDDILSVLDHYFLAEGEPGYDARYDRSYLGPNGWNLGPPDGQILVDDILHAVNSYFHDCG